MAHWLLSQFNKQPRHNSKFGKLQNTSSVIPGAATKQIDGGPAKISSEEKKNGAEGSESNFFFQMWYSNGENMGQMTSHDFGRGEAIAPWSPPPSAAPVRDIVSRWYLAHLFFFYTWPVFIFSHHLVKL